ncbi:MAG: methyltransferase domain-containing protein [Phycisphaerae bacterium]|nr:methyltransferase domain-containing protein [Phycisphaerae bacterium]
MRPAMKDVVDRLDQVQAVTLSTCDHLARHQHELAGLRSSVQGFQDRVERLLARMERRLVSGAVWRGGLRGSAVDELGQPVPEMTEKYRSELGFWESLVRRDAMATWAMPFEEVYGGWQKTRMTEFVEFLGIEGSGDALDALAAWAVTRRALEIGSGPLPSISLVRWEQAVALDPLAEGFITEGLVPRAFETSRVVFLAATGESIPIPSDAMDLVVLENCLDHIEDPSRVLRECARVLRPGGLAWILVDLMDYRDHLHPNPFSQASIKDLLSGTGFETIRDRTSDHKSHPNAYGEYRVLARRTSGRP